MAEDTLTLNHPPESSSSSSGSGRRPPPPLPPRHRTQPTDNSPYSDPPPSYDAVASPSVAESNKAILDQSWNAQDPRSSSTQSLTPAANNAQGSRRRLLCVYIHGFMGNETSFRSFPAHVHNLLTVLLAETHVVHTKIYPRYRSKRNISFARDDFSRWLEPHEGELVDVVLLGHSMGGLVSAEVVLMPPAAPLSRPLKHRIIGSINFDVPFLGMHPGVVKSGLASIFTTPPEAPADKWEGTELAPTVSTPDGARPTGTPSPASPLQHADTFWQPERPDPNYNPSFQNDVTLPMRKGWRNAWHFVNKHSDSLGKATKQLVTSHLEFGGAMANYGELKARYARVRALEEDSTAVRKSIATGNVPPPRVRFVNYYTACHGRPKVVKENPEDKELPSGVGSKASLEIEPESIGAGAGSGLTLSRTPSPRISLEEHRDGKVETKEPVIPSSDDDDDDDWKSATSTAQPGDMQHVDPAPEAEAEAATEPMSPSPSIPTLSHTSTGLSLTASLPPVPDLPTAPPPLDTSYIEDKDTRKLVEKEHARSVRAYEKAVKDREKIIKDRAKLEEKREKKMKKELEKAEKDAQKAREKAERDDKKSMKKDVVEEKKEEKRELTHSEREEKRLAEERERMEREGRRMRGEPEPGATPQTVPVKDDSDSEKHNLTRTTTRSSLPPPTRSTTLSSTQPLTNTDTRTSSRSPSPSRSHPEENNKPKKPKGPPKDRKFCTLPPKDSRGERDPCWVRIFMKDVDEVGAHCGLFFVDERYERLVGDVASRVEGWVREAGH